MKKTGIRKIAWKVAIISVVILAASAYYLSSWLPVLPVACSRARDWWEEKTSPTAEERRAKRIAYLENFEHPKLSGKQVAEILRVEQIIKTQELYDMAHWYVHHGDENVIRQIIDNQRFQMKVSLPRECGGTSDRLDCYVTGRYLVPLSWYPDTVGRIYRRELYKYVESTDAEPPFVYFLMGLAPPNDKEKSYYEQIFHDDILLYLKIYARYTDWPTIKEEAKYKIVHYPCGWRDWSTIDEVLKIAEEEGAESAYELYMQRYQSNYQSFSSTIKDLNDWKKRYKYESILQGWCSENIKGEMRVYNVESNEAVIGIRHVEKIILVLRDGEDITHLCHVTPEKDMTIPLKAAELIELDYKVNVGPQWWDRYHAK